MRIQHNIMAMSAYRNYTNNVSAMKKNLEKLSSGYKINRAGDDAAGLAISEKMRAQITGLQTAQKNAKDGISLVQTAEGALTEVHDMLNRMVELATMSANGTYDNTTDRYQLQKEVDQLRSEINRIADSANFNGIKLLDGSMSKNEEVPFEVSTSLGAADVEYDKAYDTGVFGSVAAAPASGVAPGTTGDTVLHGDGHAGVKGSFTVALDQLFVAAPSASGTAAITIKIGNASVTVSAASAGNGMDGKAIAAALAGSNAGKFLVMGSDGTLTVAAASGSLSGTNALVYEANDNNDGTVTYTLSGYMDAAGSYQAMDTARWANLDTGVSTALKAAADHTLNLTVGVATSAGAITDNRTNYGTIDVTNTLVNDPAKFGSAKMSFALPSNAASMKITLGAGSSSVTLEFQLTSNAIGLGSGAIDVSGLTSEEAKKRAIANALHNAAADASLGINVGLNSSGTDITLSEITDGAGSSAAPKAIQDAMRTEEGFSGLLKVDLGIAQQVVNTSTLTVDDSKLYEGNTAEITVGSNTTKYVFTSDEAKLAATGSAVPANTKYVSLEGDVVKNLANAIKDVTSATTTVAGGKITITGVNSVTFGNNVGWTGNSGLTLQIGDTAEKFNQLNVNIKDCHTDAMGMVGVDGTLTSIADISIADQKSAADAVDVIKAAVNYVSDVRGTLGATQNRLDHTINNLSVMTENIQDAESTIRDVDVAEEMMAYTKNNILIQSAQAMLAQANQVPQGVLQLLG